MQQVRVNTRLSFGSAQPSNVAQFSVGALTYIAKGSNSTSARDWATFPIVKRTVKFLDEHFYWLNISAAFAWPVLTKEENMNGKLRAFVAATALAACGSVGAVTVNLQPSADGQLTGSFQGAHSAAGNLVDRYEFVSPLNGLLSFTLDSAAPTGTAGVAFLGYGLSSGPGLVLFSSSNPHVAVGPLAIPAGDVQLSIGFNAAPALIPDAPASTSYSGTLTISALAIPEPETWLLMSVGLLAVMGVRRVVNASSAGMSRRPDSIPENWRRQR